MADDTLAPVTLMGGVRYRVGTEVVIGWYGQKQFDRVVELL